MTNVRIFALLSCFLLACAGQDDGPDVSSDERSDKIEAPCAALNGLSSVCLDDGRASAWCDSDGVVYKQTCSCNSTCYIERDGAAYCGKDPVTFSGSCIEGDTAAQWCDADGIVHQVDCAEGETCGYQRDGGAYCE